MYTLLKTFFTEGISPSASEDIGLEVETIYVDESGQPAHAGVTQAILRRMIERNNRWSVTETGFYAGEKRIASIMDTHGNKIVFEIGVSNLEVVTQVAKPNLTIETACEILQQLEQAAAIDGTCRPHLGPIVYPKKSVLAPMSEREKNFLNLDGHDVTNMMACTACVQFTIQVTPKNAVRILERLHAKLPDFLARYPQETIWRRYVRESKAGYLESRYGGPTGFDSIADYCGRLAEHRVLTETGLLPWDELSALDVAMFVKSVWWYFRLKRYGNQLCLEIRPLKRGTDDEIASQWSFVENIVRE